MGTGRPRKTSYSPLQREVLWLLEEAGAELLITIVHSLSVEIDEAGLVHLSGELAGLDRGGLIELWQLPGDKGSGAAFAQRLEPPVDLPGLLARRDGGWVQVAGVEVVLTDEGRAALTR